MTAEQQPISSPPTLASIRSERAALRFGVGAEPVDVERELACDQCRLAGVAASCERVVARDESLECDGPGGAA